MLSTAFLFHYFLLQVKLIPLQVALIDNENYYQLYKSNYLSTEREIYMVKGTAAKNLKKDDSLYDVTIIGGGAVGLFTTFYSGLRGLKTKLIEAGNEVGGKVTIGFPEKTISDIGGIPEITGAALVEQLVQQAKTFDPTIICGQWISEIRRLEDGSFRLKSYTGEIHETRTIILTVGNGTIQPIKLDVHGVEKFENNNLHYHVRDLQIFKDKRILISGGGDSAVDWANELDEIAEKVTVIHRRDEFRAFESSVQKMKKQVDVLTPYTIQQLSGEGKQIKQATLEHLETGRTENIEVDALLVNHGFTGDIGGINQWGLHMQDGQIVVNDAMETNIPGIFAAGDTVAYPNRLNLFVAGFTEGPVAVYMK